MQLAAKQLIEGLKATGWEQIPGRFLRFRKGSEMALVSKKGELKLSRNHPARSRYCSMGKPEAKTLFYEYLIKVGQKPANNIP